MANLEIGSTEMCSFQWRKFPADLLKNLTGSVEEIFQFANDSNHFSGILKWSVRSLPS